MKLHNLKTDDQVVDFATAVRTGLGLNQGLFFPKSLPRLPDVDAVLAMDFVSRSQLILSHFVSENIDAQTLLGIVKDAFDFPLPLRQVNDREHCLELFHGPTLAFKDFGARFMARCLQQFAGTEKITILTATSGDTGAAVAHAFHGLDNIEVVILFPKGKIAELQQKMFTTLSDNIRTVAIEGAFDDCQAMVKQCFDDPELVKAVGLNSANSINVSRLFAQTCYYFEAIAQLPKDHRSKTAVAVPSGNFGNLCAGIMAQTMGLPIKRFIASTNLNDTVPRYLQDGVWSPNATVETLSNAMDVSRPNNWPRIQYLMDSGQFEPSQLTGLAVDEERTALILNQLHQAGYISEPHAAVAYQGMHDSLQGDEVGIFLGTAHPAKFKDAVEDILNIELPLPAAIQACAELPDRSVDMAADVDLLKAFLRET